MQKTRLLLIRHAETSAPQVFHGAESDIGLSDRGRDQARRLADHLRGEGLRAVYCSAMRRARDTAGPVADACGLEPVVIPGLHERKIGPLSGLGREEGWEVYAATKARWIAGDLDATHEGGESFAAIAARVLPIIERIAADHPGEAVAVIAHGIVIRVVLLSLLPDRTPADFDSIAIDFASINDLRRDGRTWAARRLNEVVAPSPDRPVA
ncbi:Phosphoserine phosphatase 1 [Aquisphaera giovannonii]|uniref:Phosphoserine phosphatase 1 n=1 Tax=Aquisphaera giovannonii TaxID=406548 RepID=A0A5B9WEQ1_9BACT|nr:histidine phosphatase family protein [Aquisphaera giovannonii]QEH38360.1 Phosphoserine phosphatase 1 [Aquisphaera giovannonii]